MTFSDVADRIGLSAPSVTYYFKKKENLAEAVLDRGLDELHSHALSAASFATPDTRVEQFLRLELKSLARAHRGEAARRAHIGELRALEEPMGSRLNRRYVEIFRLVRGFFGTDSVRIRTGRQYREGTPAARQYLCDAELVALLFKWRLRPRKI